MKKIHLFSLILLIAVSVFGGWSTSFSRDEMTGEGSAYALSSVVSSTAPMGFPHGDTRAWIGVGCDSDDEWAFIGFNSSPNLTDTDTEDGYNLIDTRIKWDDQVEKVTLKHVWGSKFLHFYGTDAEVVKKIEECGTVLLELKWYGQGSVYFKFSLSGSSAAISKVRNQCQ